MSVNRELPHLYVIPEDDADKDIVNGFIYNLNVKRSAIQVLPVAGGWPKVAKYLAADTGLHRHMDKYPECRVAAVIDFDGDVQRAEAVRTDVPEGFRQRVFIIGVLSEPEELRKATAKTLEQIGDTLAEECAGENRLLWNHDLLKHNACELAKLEASVRDFLFG